MTKRQDSAREARKSADTNVAGIHRVRICVVGAVLLVSFSVIAVRLILFQVHPDLKLSQEDLKHIGMVEIHRPRGQILDTSGRVLATDRDVPSLSANPSKVTDAQALTSALCARLDLDPEVVFNRLTRRDGDGRMMKFVWIKRWLTPEEEDQLGQLEELPNGEALSFQTESVRFYPEQDLASHVLGFANREGAGSEGVELAFDEYLKSTPGRRVSRVDRDRNILGFLTLEYEPPRGGDDVYLTIDASLQFALERELDRAMEENKAPRAMGLLMDSNTGAILAMASRPAFDPNHYSDYSADLRRNRAIVDVFEPGSSFKIVTAAAALEHGLITPDEKIDCEQGSFNPYGHRIRDVHKLGIEPFWKCYAESSNIAMIKVAALLGEKRLETWIRRFGFGTRTGLDIPGESPGIFRPQSKWSRLSMGSLPIGQEVAVTMPQLAQAFSVIANGGYLVEPYIVERASSEEGVETYRHSPARPKRVVSVQTAAIMRDLCHLVVSDQESTGWRAAIPEYRVGGKTGTAQIARPGGGGYYRDKYTTVFAGFAPIANPKVTCVIVVQEPNIRNHYGGYVCGPVFKKVVRETLIKLNAPQDPMENLEVEPENEERDDEPDADMVVARQNWDAVEPIEPTPQSALDSLKLLPQAGDPIAESNTLPSFLGLTKREAKRRIVELGLHWDPQGAGRVVEQAPPPGTRLADVSVCQLVFSSASKSSEDEV